MYYLVKVDSRTKGKNLHVYNHLNTYTKEPNKTYIEE